MTHFLDSIVMPTFVKLQLKSNLWTLVSFQHVKSLEVIAPILSKKAEESEKQLFLDTSKN